MPDLGKYAATVLSAYGVTAVVMLALVLWSWRRGAAARRRLDQLQARRAARK